MDQIMGRGQGLDSIKVKRAELLAELENNREKHISEFKLACVGFIVSSIKELKVALKNAKQGKIESYLKFDKPVSHEKDYDTVISMLQFSVDDEVYITKDQFESYVQDNWNWKNAFNLTNSKYLSK